MSNNYSIPEDVVQRIRRRDKRCVYCHKKMIYPCTGNNRSNWATIEHLDEEGPAYWDEGLKERGLAICCGGCNSSRGTKALREWFKSSYCIERKITQNSVNKPVKEYLRRPVN